MKQLFCCKCGAETTTRKFMSAGWFRVILSLKGGGKATHATEAGYDLQVISRTCWHCDGTGMFARIYECRSCGGTGIYGPDKGIVLRRFDLAGRIYHVPTERGEVNEANISITKEIVGLIKHDTVCHTVAMRCYFRLLLRWEPTHFYDLAMGWLIRPKGSNARLFKLIKLRNSMDLFPAIPSVNPVNPVSAVTT